jgi:YegS/Rv2252/BmrU family lipid kinase
MIPAEQWFVIINPTSGNGSAKRKWPKIKALLQAYNFNFSHVFTAYPNHGTELVQNAVNEGVTQFICVGGDGTIHNIVNGFMAQEVIPSSSLKLGVIPIGTGNDWVKTHGIPKNIEDAIKRIKNGELRHQDVGRIEFPIKELDPVFFNNLAGVGFDGYVVSKVQKYKSLGAISYLVGAITGLFRFSNFNVKVELNNRKIETRALMVLVGLCQFSGGGMQLTSAADPNDGYFDISIAKDFRKGDILKNLFKLFNGKITNSEKVFSSKTALVSILVSDQDLPYIQADGEIIGRGSFKATIVPKALSFYA